MIRILPFIVPLLWMATSLSAHELTDETFAELHQSLKPNSDEHWRTIPWKISLIEAQHAAIKQNKPIFIWAMDGHPLGCT